MKTHKHFALLKNFFFTRATNFAVQEGLLAV